MKLIRKIKLKDDDNDRGGFSMQKLYQFFRLLMPKYTKTLLNIKKFTDLDVEKLNKEKNLDIKGLIMDCDETISYNLGPILKENIEHLYKLDKQGIKLAIFSNMQDSNRYDILPKNLIVIKNVKSKPDIDGFLKAKKLLKLKSNQLLMLGDNYFTDAGSIRAKIKFVKVDPIKTKNEKLGRKFSRIPEKTLRTYGDILAKLHKLLKINH